MKKVAAIMGLVASVALIYWAANEAVWSLMNPPAPVDDVKLSTIRTLLAVVRYYSAHFLTGVGAISAVASLCRLMPQRGGREPRRYYYVRTDR